MASYLERLRSHPIRKELAFDAPEYDDRLLRTRRELEHREMDILLVHDAADICYLCGYETPGTALYACLALAANGRRVLQVADHEVSCAVLTSCIEDVRSYRWYEAETIPHQTASIISDLTDGNERVTIGLERESTSLSVATYEELLRSFPRATWVDGSNIVPNLRKIKSANEIALLRESGRITSIGIDAALNVIRAGCSDNDVAGAGYAAMVEAGSEYVSTQPFVATGLMSSLVHATFKRRTISAGDTVLLEFASSYRRYSAPMMRSAVVGPPSVSVQKLVDAVEKTLNLLLEHIQAGRTAHEIASAAAQGLSPVRDEIYFQGAYGYQVGVSLPPGWGEGTTPYIAAGVHEELKTGMVFHLPVAARIPAVCGVALSETIVVTDEGCDIITSPTRGFRVVTE